MTRLIATSPVTAALLGICTTIELALLAADLGLIGLPRLRATAYEYGGFWPGLLQDWRPNYAAQPALMFVTHGFLHGGPLHLAVNMLTLASLGPLVAERTGEWRYLGLYVTSILGGAAGYAVLAPGLVPMVGASGALFGLAGAIVVAEFVERRALGEPLAPVARMIALLILLNAVLWWAMAGHLAWQAHLGGFLAGAAASLILGRDAPASR